MTTELKAPVQQQSSTKKTSKRNRSSQNLVTILSTAFLLLSAIGLLISNGFQLYTIIQIQQNAINYNQLAIAQNAVKTLNGFVEDKFAVLSTIAWQFNPNKSSSSAQTQVLTSLLVREPKFNQLILFNANNKETALASRIVINSKASYTRFASFITDKMLNQIKEGQRYIGSVYYDEYTGAPLVVMAVPMTDALGNYQGTLAAELNLISIWPLVNNLQVGKTGYIYVVDNQGNLVAFKDAKRELAGENVIHISEVKKFVENPEAAMDLTPDATPYTGLTGTTVVGRYIPLGTPQWAVVIETPVREAYQEAIAHAIQSVLVIIGMIILAGLAGRYLARRLATPLIELTNVANQVADGRLDLQVTPSGSTEVTSLAYAFNSMTSQLRATLTDLEKRVKERTAELELANEQNQHRAKQFESISQIARTISSSQELDKLLAQITVFISREFNFYHVGVFLVDSVKEYAILSAANSDGGQAMLARGHRLKIGEKGLVGYVTATGRARLALDTGTDAVFFNNPDLPDTHSEIALPLHVGEEIIGALDVQSTKSKAFSQEDVNILTTLADQVSIAIQNARQFEETRRALNESEALARQFVQAGWQQFNRTQKLTGILHSGARSSLLYKNVGKEQGSSSTGQFKTKGRGALLTLPLKLRGESIGSLEVRSPDGRQFDQDEMDIVKAIIERAVLAMENARLLTESQKLAAKERTIGDISTKISAQSDIKELLRTATQELGRTLPGMDIAIQLNKDETD